MNHTNAVATVLTSATALDTNDDSLEAFDTTATHMESEASLSGPALLELAQRAVAERDALRGEVVRLREALTKSEANARRGAGSSRELAELREGLELREREVRRLKDANVARERLLMDARGKLDEALAARQAAIVRLEVRDRAAAEAESQRDVAVAEAIQWKKKFDAVDSELHRALAAERALSGTIDDARLQLSEAERTIIGLRAELAETRQALTELDAVASRREIEHRDEVAALVEKIRAANEAHDRAIATHQAREKQIEEEHRAALIALEERHIAALATLEDELRAEHEGRELAVRYLASEQIEQARTQWLADKSALRGELRALLDDMDRMREEHGLDLAAWKARNSAERENGEAAVEGCNRGWAFRYAELSRELELERAARMCEATRQGQAMNAVREANEFAVTALRARLVREQERAKKAEDELDESVKIRDEAAVVIAEVLSVLEARVERLERERAQLRVMFDESEMTREALAQEVVEACKRATAARSKCDELERELDVRTRQMAELVGNLTRATVEQHAIAGALKRGRPLPTMADVDAALLAVSRRVPEHMSAVLWGARDAIAAAIFAAADPSPLA
jgi:hypothetical protein